MALKDFVRIKAKDPDLYHVQDNIQAFSRQFNKTILDGKIIEAEVGTSTTLVGHKLARAYQGWHIVDIQGDARVWRDAGSKADNTRYLPLKASATVNVKIWVF